MGLEGSRDLLKASRFQGLGCRVSGFGTKFTNEVRSLKQFGVQVGNEIQSTYPEPSRDCKGCCIGSCWHEPAAEEGKMISQSDHHETHTQ